MKLPRVTLRRPTLRQVALGVPGVLVSIVFVVLFARNADTIEFPDYEVPEGFTPAPAPTTAPPGVALPTLHAVAGTTTTVLPGLQGTSEVHGSVTGPQGPIGGATVRIERSVRGRIQRLDVVAGPDGGWGVPGLSGGAYRVRAFLPPTLAQRTAEVFFLTAGEQRPVDLVLESFAEPVVTIGVAPNPPLLDQPLNLAIQVTTRTVDADGIVRSQPLAGASVDVAIGGAWERETPASTTTSTSSSTSSTSTSSTSTTTFGTTTSTTEPASPGLVTDANGQVTVEYVCRSPGPAQVTVSVVASPGATPTVAVLAAPDCIDPATTTTASTAPPTSDVN